MKKISFLFMSLLILVTGLATSLAPLFQQSPAAPPRAVPLSGETLQSMATFAVRSRTRLPADQQVDIVLVEPIPSGTVCGRMRGPSDFDGYMRTRRFVYLLNGSTTLFDQGDEGQRRYFAFQWANLCRNISVS